MRRVLVAPDKFKGSLDAVDAAGAIGRGIHAVRPDTIVDLCPVADGGDGTVAVVRSYGFEPRRAIVTGPLGNPVTAEFAVQDGRAVIEMCSAAGMGRLPGLPNAHTALTADTAGVGDLIREALNLGARRIVVGLGGSAGTDGGAGALRALGAHFTSRDEPAAHGGGALADLRTVDLSGLDPRLQSIELVLACDVDNPLLGPEGCAAMFGPQKGADAAAVRRLELGLAHWADLVEAASGRVVRQRPGAGAAGGLGFGLMAGLGAVVESGISFVLGVAGFAERLRNADLVIVGEGSLDEQSLRGKGPVGVARIARRAGVPVAAVVGRSLVPPGAARDCGIDQVISLEQFEPDVVRRMSEADRLLEFAGRHVAAAWKKED
ncbi:glycerate kinase [Kribbella sp. NPDC050124]|uniref:glycerate kinase n=1 Tax=Kribbella sp. NPDC050124 TaxID=3364114 RepID=UPI00378DB648